MSAIRNILIMSGVAVGGFLAYRYFGQRYFSGDIPQDYAPPTPDPYRPGVVRADQLSTVRTGTAITKKEKGMQYFPILSEKRVGLATERTFRPSIDGFYTGRILTQAKKQYAEVQPSSSSLSGMGGLYEDLVGSFASMTQQLDALSGKRIRGERQSLMRQRVGIKRQIRTTPEFIAAQKTCSQLNSKMNAERRTSNLEDMFQVVTNPISLKCDIYMLPTNEKDMGD